MLSDPICQLYRSMPVAVLIFENQTLIHINKHLYEIFSVDALVTDLKEITAELYYAIFQELAKTPILSDSDIFAFLIEQNRLNYKNQQIQVEYQPVGRNSVFVLTRIRRPQEYEPLQLKINRANEQKILGLFLQTKKREFQLFSMFRGLHIKSEALFMGIESNYLIFRVSKKHLASYHDNNEFIIRLSADGLKVIVANGIAIDISKQQLTLGDLRLSTESAMQRRTIRIKCIDEKIMVRIDHGSSYPIYDLSLYSVALQTPPDVIDYDPEATQPHKLQFTLAYDAQEVFLSIDATVHKVMKMEGYLKIIFLFLPNDRAAVHLKAYLSSHQLKSLRLLKSAVTQMERFTATDAP